MDIVIQPDPDTPDETEPADAGAYCRAVERHLCQRNLGNLVRIVGPSFELVCGWAARGVPIRVAYHGIDRYVARQAQKGPRRRPIRVEFCDADVLDVFDEWRRAIGVPRQVEAVDDDAPGEAHGHAPRRHGSLSAHLERTVARLTTVIGRVDAVGLALADHAASVARELDALRHQAKSVRGDARTMLLERLRTLDRGLLDAARDHIAGPVHETLLRRAEAELAPFKDRMSADAYAGALQSLGDRLLREHYQLPVVTLD